MSKRLWEEKYKNRKDMLEDDECFCIDEEDFNKLMYIYQFKPINETKCFFDNKRNMTVAKIDKYNILLFNKFWLNLELNATNLQTIKDICNKYVELYDIMYKYKIKKKINELYLVSCSDRDLRNTNRMLISKLKKELSDADNEKDVS